MQRKQNGLYIKILLQRNKYFVDNVSFAVEKKWRYFGNEH